MDYEKRYKEALNLAKSYYGKDTNEFLDTIFPELAESEDERIGNLIYCIVRDREDVRATLGANGVSVDTALAYLEKQKKQKPAEWSEEDEKMVSWIRTALSTSAYITPRDTKIVKKWLENRLKSLRPQPHWKPSEEQMEALSASNSYWRGITSVTPRINILASLYNDLKKL